MVRLVKELSYYKKNKEEFVKKYSNQYLLIKGEQLIGNYTSEQEAYAAGVQKFGNEPFLIKLASDVSDQPVQTPALWVTGITEHVDSK